MADCQDVWSFDDFLLVSWRTFYLCLFFFYSYTSANLETQAMGSGFGLRRIANMIDFIDAAVRI